MKRIFSTLCAIAILCATLLCQSSTAQIINCSSVILSQSITFHSTILNEDRTIRVQVPRRSNPFGSYPVLYVLDGEVLGNMAGSQVQYLSESYHIIPNLIVVSIDNRDRIRDLTPTHSVTGPDGRQDTSSHAFGYTSGGGEQFLRFMKEELIPYVETRYPVAPYRILCGHSLGGLIALHCIATHPEYFNAYIAISPSLQWDNGVVLQELASAKQSGNATRRLFFSDADEGVSFHQNQLALDSLLGVKNIPGLDYRRVAYAGETHLSEPVKAFYDAIRFIYPDWSLPYNKSSFRATVTASTVKDHYALLSKKYGYPVVPPHDEINQLSRFLCHDTARISDAIVLLEMNANSYPGSAIVQEQLGDTWLMLAKEDKALAAYKAALQLESNNEGLRKKVRALNHKRKRRG